MLCGREPGGAKVSQYGVCPATNETRLDGINGGVNGGRACWGIPGTHCLDYLRPTEKFGRCLECRFFQLVEREEARNFEVMRKILKRLG